MSTVIKEATAGEELMKSQLANDTEIARYNLIFQYFNVTRSTDSPEIHVEIFYP